MRRKNIFTKFDGYLVLPTVQLKYQSVLIHLWSDGVFDAHYANAVESGENLLLIVPVRLPLGGGEASAGQADGPEALLGHGLDGHLL